MSKHTHRWKVTGVRGVKSKSLSCRCGARINDVPLTPDEVRQMMAGFKEQDKRSNALHKTWWAFKDHFINRQPRGSKWKYRGWDMMKEMERFAEKHPDVIICHCDDSWHMGSSIALIPHRNRHEYWGTTMVCVPQCGCASPSYDEEPVEMFLYPGHLEDILEQFVKIKRETRVKGKTTNRRGGWWPGPELPNGVKPKIVGGRDV